MSWRPRNPRGLPGTFQPSYRARATDPKIQQTLDRDVPRIDAMLREIFARAAIDPRQIVLVGYSDGASYALSLALANSAVFPSVIALSPGFVKLPARFETGQRIFIAHGTRDTVIPIEAARRIADELKSNQLSVRFRPFDGGHGLSRPTILEGLDSVLMSASERT